jgi:hypothetical protein
MQLGENGMPEYMNSGIRSNVLAISQMVHAGDPSSLADKIFFAKDMPVQDLVDLVIIVFVTRNTQGGKGEKDLSFKILLQVWKKFPETSAELLGLFSQFGYWKDLLLLMKMAVEDVTIKGLNKAAFKLMSSQLKKDMAALAEYKSNKVKSPKISILAKWLPREGMHFDKKLSFVK